MSSPSSGPDQTCSSLQHYAIAIVKTRCPRQKVALAREAARAWHAGDLPASLSSKEPEIPRQPGRPDKPLLLSPREMPKRKAGSEAGLVALIHALVHIELNAIDMAFDLIARWSDTSLPVEFLDEALKIGVEEAQHFEMINAHLEELAISYGDLPAHGNLWDAVVQTSHDLLARLAIVPLVLEARGLDVSPKMIAQVKAQGEHEIASTMDIIYRDEISHVAFGAKWFKFICAQKNIDAEDVFHFLVKKHFKGHLRPPFNEKARQVAGLEPGFYEPLSISRQTSRDSHKKR